MTRITSACRLAYLALLVVLEVCVLSDTYHLTASIFFQGDIRFLPGPLPPSFELLYVEIVVVVAFVWYNAWRGMGTIQMFYSRYFGEKYMDRNGEQYDEVSEVLEGVESYSVPCTEKEVQSHGYDPLSPSQLSFSSTVLPAPSLWLAVRLAGVAGLYLVLVGMYALGVLNETWTGLVLVQGPAFFNFVVCTAVLGVRYWGVSGWECVV